MSKDRITKLIEAFDSLGYEIAKFDSLYKSDDFYGNIELILLPHNEKEIMLKEKMVKLVEVLASYGYGIAKYRAVCKHVYGDIELVLFDL